MSCAAEYNNIFYALASLSGHPLRPRFLGDVEGCRRRGFRYFTVRAVYGYDGGSLPEMFFGLCTPMPCTVAHVESHLAPLYLYNIFENEGVRTDFSKLDVTAKDLLEMPSWAAPLSVAVGVLETVAYRTTSRIPDRLPAVICLRGAATVAMCLYHAFYFQRDFRFVMDMPYFARRVQHACILHTSVFSAMSVGLLYRSFVVERRLKDGKSRVHSWCAWAAVRLIRKVVRQGPAILLAYLAYHQLLRVLSLVERFDIEPFPDFSAK